MQLLLQNIIPIPLRDKITGNTSGVWNNAVHFHKGERIFIQAPSGTGKTTLVHILYGLRSDYQGNVLWDNKPLSGMDAETLAGLRTRAISVVFQDMRLFPGLTAWENIDIKRRLTDTITEQQAADWLGRLGLADKKNATGSTLSYGEQQRIAIIRALVQPFRWLLMDEPFSHLDHVNTQKAIALISEVAAQRDAGMLLADLDENDYFPYTKTIRL